MDEMYNVTLNLGSEKKVIATNDPQEILKAIQQSKSKWFKVDDHTIVNLDNVTNVTYFKQQAVPQVRSVRNPGL